MRSLLLSLTVVLLCVIVTFSALNAVGVQKETASAAAGICLGAFPYFHKALQRYSTRPLPALARDQVVSLELYAMPTGVLVTYGALVGLALSQGLGVVIGIITALAAVMAGQQPSPAFMMLQLPFTLLAAYLIGRWIGVRSRRRKAWIVTAVSAIVASIEHIGRLLLFSSEEYLSTFGEERTAAVTGRNWIGSIVLWTAVGLIGFARGRKIRLARYAEYLLRKLPVATRDAVLSLLHDEVASLAEKKEAGPARRISAEQAKPEPRP